MPSVITTLVLRKSGGAIVTLLDGIYSFDFVSSELKRLAAKPDEWSIVFNDGKVDSAGRFIIGGSTTNFENPTTDGGLYSFGDDHILRKIGEDIHISNGPCFAPDNRTLYFSDSWISTCYAYDYDVDSGLATNRRPFVTTENISGRPDGATVDSGGLIWIAIYGAGKVVAYRPDGRVERTISLPVKLVSSVMFGGEKLDQLFVTTISHGALGEQTEENAGSLYVVSGLGVRGIREPKYTG